MGTIIALVGLKGGVSKTITTINLACCAQALGHRVAIAETTGEQKHCQEWRDRSLGNTKGFKAPPVFALSGNAMVDSLLDLAEDRDLVFVDTPGWMGNENRIALGVADIALLPVTPGAGDVSDLFKTLALVTEVQAMRRSNPLRAAAIMTRAKTGSALATMATKAISNAGVSLLTSATNERAAVGKADLAGLSVLHCPDDKARREFQRLTLEVLDELTWTAEAAQ